jgi:hypothetical protein
MLTNEQQKAMAEHVKYEIDEFRNSLRDLPSLRGRRRLWNRTLESALLHFRILRGFFFGEGTNPSSDVHASHFISAWQPTKDPIFDNTKRAVDKVLAHLTLERVTNPTMLNWPDLDRMGTAMEVLISEFWKSLSPTQATWFPRLEEIGSLPVIGSEGNRTDSGPR